MSLGLKGSTRSTHSSATQPLPTPASVSSRVVPVLYLGEDSKLAEFGNCTQESISKGSSASTGVSIEVIDNIHSLSITPPPPSQPHIITKTAVSVKPVKSMWHILNQAPSKLIWKAINQLLPCQNALKQRQKMELLNFPTVQGTMQAASSLTETFHLGVKTEMSGAVSTSLHLPTGVGAMLIHGLLRQSADFIFHVCWALTLAAHGNLQLEKLMSASKPQKHAILLKGNSGVTWEVIIPDGKPYGSNFQM
ncbi:hypothetical protein BKA82DRAFT_4010446 [Pisolithus tinctorius]|nr:hypothetical protein BKA82DRAFT_4010446 [Pisolithus tinctorius]